MANDDVEVSDNALAGNATANVMIVSYRFPQPTRSTIRCRATSWCARNAHGRAGFDPQLPGGGPAGRGVRRVDPAGAVGRHRRGPEHRRDATPRCCRSAWPPAPRSRPRKPRAGRPEQRHAARAARSRWCCPRRWRRAAQDELLRAANRIAAGAGDAGAAATLALAQTPAAVNDAAITGDALPAALSDYRLLHRPEGAHARNARLFGYTLNTPLFSDYAEKQRYLYVPAGTDRAVRSRRGARPPGRQRDREDVRLPAIRRVPPARNPAAAAPRGRLGGAALCLERRPPRRGAEARRHAHARDLHRSVRAQPRTISYAVPNQNQCKDCHELSGRDRADRADGAQPQPTATSCRRLVAAGMLDRAPADAPRLARWDDATAPLGARAAAYLEINCAHCHNAARRGVQLRPVPRLATSPTRSRAALASIRSRRGAAPAAATTTSTRAIPTIRSCSTAWPSTEPGIAMPELGRATAHAEALAMLTRWIAGMPR